MTRLAVGTPEAPLLSGLFIAMGRAAVAAALSLLLVVVFLWGAAGRIVAQIAAALLAAIVAERRRRDLSRLRRDDALRNRLLSRG